MKISYEVATTPHVDGTIIQEVHSQFGDVRQRVLREMMDTREQQTREALIALGWTPPNALVHRNPAGVSGGTIC